MIRTGWMKTLFDLDGRIQRLLFLRLLVLAFFIPPLLGIVEHLLGGGPDLKGVWIGLSLSISLLGYWVILSAVVRRLHDLALPGTLVFGVIAVRCFLGSLKFPGNVQHAVSFVIWGVFLGILALLQGTDEINRFGSHRQKNLDWLINQNRPLNANWLFSSSGDYFRYYLALVVGMLVTSLISSIESLGGFNSVQYLAQSTDSRLVLVVLAIVSILAQGFCGGFAAGAVACKHRAIMGVINGSGAILLVGLASLIPFNGNFFGLVKVLKLLTSDLAQQHWISVWLPLLPSLAGGMAAEKISEGMSRPGAVP